MGDKNDPHAEDQDAWRDLSDKNEGEIVSTKRPTNFLRCSTTEVKAEGIRLMLSRMMMMREKVNSFNYNPGNGYMDYYSFVLIWSQIEQKNSKKECNHLLIALKPSLFQLTK